jgi:ribonuclease III
VRGRNLAEIADKLGFSSAIQLSRGEALALGYENPYILANTLEAMIGAIYLDLGIDRARIFILAHVYTTLPHILAKGLYVDPKSYLQEYTQAVWGITPTYEVAEEI